MPRISSTAIEVIRHQPGLLCEKRAAKLIQILSGKKGDCPTPSPAQLQAWLFALCRALLANNRIGHGGAVTKLPQELMLKVMSKLPMDDLSSVLLVNKEMSTHVQRAVRDMCIQIAETRLDELPSRNANETYMNGNGRFQRLYEYILKHNKGGLRFQSINLLYRYSLPIYYASKTDQNADGVEMAGRQNIVYSTYHRNDAFLTATMYHEMPKNLDRFLGSQTTIRLVRAVYFMANHKHAVNVMSATRRAIKKRYDDRNFDQLDGVDLHRPDANEINDHNREDWVTKTTDKVILEGSVFRDYGKLMELALDAEIAYTLCSLAPPSSGRA